MGNGDQAAVTAARRAQWKYVNGPNKAHPTGRSEITRRRVSQYDQKPLVCMAQETDRDYTHTSLSQNTPRYLRVRVMYLRRCIWQGSHWSLFFFVKCWVCCRKEIFISPYGNLTQNGVAQAVRDCRLGCACSCSLFFCSAWVFALNLYVTFKSKVKIQGDGVGQIL